MHCEKSFYLAIEAFFSLSINIKYYIFSLCNRSHKTTFAYILTLCFQWCKLLNNEKQTKDDKRLLLFENLKKNTIKNLFGDRLNEMQILRLIKKRKSMDTEQSVSYVIKERKKAV